eukprot:gene32171-16707_t
MMEIIEEQQLPIPKALLKVALAAMKRSVKKKARFDIDKLVPASFIPALFGHAEGDTFVKIRHSEVLHEAYAGDKNFIRFEGDHNNRRSEFFYNSVSIFFHNVLQLDTMLQGGNRLTSEMMRAYGASTQNEAAREAAAHSAHSTPTLGELPSRRGTADRATDLEHRSRGTFSSLYTNSWGAALKTGTADVVTELAHRNGTISSLRSDDGGRGGGYAKSSFAISDDDAEDAAALAAMEAEEEAMLGAVMLMSLEEFARPSSTTSSSTPASPAGPPEAALHQSAGGASGGGTGAGAGGDPRAATGPPHSNLNSNTALEGEGSPYAAAAAAAAVATAASAAAASNQPTPTPNAPTAGAGVSAPHAEAVLPEAVLPGAPADAAPHTPPLTPPTVLTPQVGSTNSTVVAQVVPPQAPRNVESAGRLTRPGTRDEEEAMVMEAIRLSLM